MLCNRVDLLARSRRHRFLHRHRIWICPVRGSDRVRRAQSEGPAPASRDRDASSSAMERGATQCVSHAYLFCWPLASPCSARRKPPLARSAIRFCHCGMFAPRRRTRCKGRGPASCWRTHRGVRRRLGYSTSNSLASRRSHLICSSRNDSPGFQGSPICRWIFGGTNGRRILGSSASRPAHAAISARSDFVSRRSRGSARCLFRRLDVAK